MAGFHPPPQYDYAPAIPVIEQVLSYDEVQKICPSVTGRALSGPERFWGCAIKRDGKCYIYTVDDQFVKRHERAHCNGWPGHHPGAW